MSKAKETAIEDIKNELSKTSRSFIAYRKKLDPIMDKLVSDYLSKQEKLKK